MNISTKGRYGIKAMVDIALNYSDENSDETISVKSIAERQNIPEKYLEQLFSVLKKAGLVKSIRGSYGGYFLARPPKNITIGEILRALEGDLAPVDCVIEKRKIGKCKRSNICITKYVWAKIRDGINHVVDEITLKQLAEGYKAETADSYMYYI
ncbi:MAG TPA: Rrf2 family transcriptional regulator [Clostridiales bacterium]|nr:Rrf2 family transcriptional regulator [Clostridiales bacterium]